HLRVDLAAGAPPGTTVTLDGEPLAPANLGVDMPIDPGKHLIVATATRAGEKRYEITVTGPERRMVEVARQRADAPRGLGWTLGIASLGVGGASLLVGVGTGAAAIAKHSSTVTLCAKGPDMCPASVQPSIDAYNRL